MSGRGWHLAFAGSRILVVEDAGGRRAPTVDELATALATDPRDLVDAQVPLPDAQGLSCRAYDLPPEFEAPAGYALVGLRAFHASASEELFKAAGTALQKVEWLRTHAYCSRCGHPTERHPVHEAMACPACGHLHFPRLAPAVIVLIERKREMLLGRSPRFPEGMYSTIAGFVEPGEALEDAVHREIREEVGVEVTDVRYFGSQPWPFPHSLMVGFTARWSGGEIRIDEKEIEDARWFSPEDLPPALPSTMSIARRLVDDFLARVTSRE